MVGTRVEKDPWSEFRLNVDILIEFPRSEGRANTSKNPINKNPKHPVNRREHPIGLSSLFCQCGGTRHCREEQSKLHATRSLLSSASAIRLGEGIDLEVEDLIAGRNLSIARIPYVSSQNETFEEYGNGDYETPSAMT